VNKQSLYGRQVQLLVQALPVIFQESCFALKGGTAINLFVRDLLRLSVDIDWCICQMNIERLPALRWKQLNLGKLSNTKRRAAMEKLRLALRMAPPKAPG